MITLSILIVIALICALVGCLMGLFSLVGLLASLVIGVLVGALAGYIAGRFMGTETSFARNAVLGVLGSFVGEFLFGLVGIHATGSFSSFVISILGACVCIWVDNKFLRPLRRFAPDSPLCRYRDISPRPGRVFPRRESPWQIGPVSAGR